MSGETYYKKITPRHSFFDLKLKEVWQHRELIGVLTKRSFQTRYRQTILGPFWLLLTPLCSSLVTYLVFGRIARLGTGEIPPVLFYLSGNALWAYFSGTLNKNSGTFRNNAYLFSKVYFPRLAMSVSYVLSDLIDFLIKMAVVVVFMVLYAVRGEIRIRFPGLLLLPFLLLLIGLMAMSIGILFSSLTTRYRDFQVMLGFLMTLWMPLTPVAYPLSEVCDPLIRKLFMLNPLTGFTELFRFALFGKGQILTGNLIWGCAFTFAAAVLGIAVFNRIERNFEDTI